MMIEIVTKRISELGEVITGNTPPTTNRSLYGGKYPLIMPTDIAIGSKYIGETEETLSEEGYEKYQKSLLPANTPCVVTIGTIGKKICLSKQDCFTNQAINAVNVYRDKYDPVFIFYLLKFNLPQVKNLSSGTASGRENVSKSSFSNIKVRLPEDLKIQQKIASILSAYDELIENNNKRIAILENMAEAIYKEWFVRLWFPGYEEVEVVDGVPEGWDNPRVSEICSLINRGIAPNYLDEGKSIVINQRCIRDNKIDLNLSRRQSKAIPPEKLVQYGDILINSTGEGTLGRAAQFYQNTSRRSSPISVDTHVTIVRAIENHHLEVLGSYIMSSQELIERLALGSTGQTELSRSDIGRLRVLIPNDDLAKRFSKLIRPMREQIVLLSNKNEVIQKTRDLLLPRLISGKLSVEHLLEEARDELVMADESIPPYQGG
ncbi:MAG: restriction endonuclease subunit S [Cyclobacteriaceae bacterium]|nr:restriction endonuclease subunit S [Cyclobacteriaceae bacterium HetDA_MAG_MS6]